MNRDDLVYMYAFFALALHSAELIKSSDCFRVLRSGCIII